MIEIINNFSNEYAFLSNFYAVNITFDGIVFPSVEHAYQAAKTLNTEMRITISKIVYPGQAKRFGKRLDLREDWESIKQNIMWQLLTKKFRHLELASKLIDTGLAELIEGNNWHDNYWGVCYCNSCHGDGLNKLGHQLMDLRDILLELGGIS